MTGVSVARVFATVSSARMGELALSCQFLMPFCPLSAPEQVWSITVDHIKLFTKHLLTFCVQNTVLRDHFCVSKRVSTEYLEVPCLSFLGYTAETCWANLWDGQILHPTHWSIQMVSINCSGHSRSYLGQSLRQTKIHTWRIPITTSQIFFCDGG